MMSPNAVLEQHLRSCTFCEAHCGIEVTVDRQANRIVGVRGDKLDPLSKGFICPKGFSLTELHSDPDRLRAPLRRRGNDFEEIGWDEALDEAAERLRFIKKQHGANSVAAYIGNPAAHNTALNVYLPGLMKTLGTNQLYSSGSVDAYPKFLSTILMFGGLQGLAVPDLDRTDHIIMIGANPVVSNGSLVVAPDFVGRLKAIRERGGKVVVVDPRRTETAKIADDYVPVRPGTDAYLLAAMVHVVFEEGLVRLGRAEGLTSNLEELAAAVREFPPERVVAATGIDAATIRRLAREFASAERAVIYGRTGTNTQRFGSIANWLIDALNVITGNLDRPGGAMFSPGFYPPVFLADKYEGDVAPFGRWKSRVGGLPELTGMLPIAAFADEVLTPGEGRVRGFVNICGNLLLSNPNGRRLEEALRGLDFMLSLDIYVNETSRFADIILPSPSHATQSDFLTLMANTLVRNVVKWSPAILPVEPDEKPDWRIMCELSARMAGVTAEEMEEEIVTDYLVRCLAAGSPAARAQSLEFARSAIGEEPGPDRLFDILVRTGPFGDAFGAKPDGLNLEVVRQHPHGLDLGPLTEQLPGILATPSGKIDLAPAMIVDDIARLRAAFPEYGRPGHMLLIGRRNTRCKNSWMHNLNLLVKGKDRCTLLMNTADAGDRNMVNGDLARVATRLGSIVVPVEITQDMMPGVVSLPHGWGHGENYTHILIANDHAGINTNLIIGDDDIDVPSAGAILNGVPVEITAALRASDHPGARLAPHDVPSEDAPIL